MATEQSEKLLSSDEYTHDTTVQSDDDVGSEEDDFAIDGLGGRSDVDRDDAEVLREDAEIEELLRKPRRFDGLRKVFASNPNDGQRLTVPRREERRQRHQERKEKRSRRISQGNEDATMMFEMEEGAQTPGSESSIDSPDNLLDIKRAKWAGQSQKSKGPACAKLALIFVFIFALFVVLVFAAYKASTQEKHTLLRPSSLSNGTHLFAPTTILFSLDGFRADFLNRDITPALNAFIASGVSPRYMLPSFPSVTFPNHFTLVTGLYPESHGVVGNQFWDPEIQEEFYYTHESISMHPRWWNAEPLWVTAEHQGVRTAIHMWPGSEAHIPDIEPTYLDRFNGTELLTNKVDRILQWLDLPGDDDEPNAKSLRPQLIAAYVPNVDTDGHKYGPNSTEIRGTIADVDSMLTMIVEGLLVRNLTEIVNIVVVSDHGMATTSTDRCIQLDDLIDMSLVDHIDGWPLRGLRLKNPERDVPIMYEQLLSEAQKQGAFDVYTLDTMPERYHFTNNHRIAPLWIVPKTGWAVLEKTDFDLAEAVANGKAMNPKGLHGYDHEHPLMRAIFVARGPAFPHEPNSRVPVFQNTEVYNIVCDSLGIAPHPNNGTLRLPLKTQGLHSDHDAPSLETPHDPDPNPNVETKPEDIDRPDLGSPPGFHDDQSESETDKSGDEDESQPKKTFAGWWDFVHGQLEKAKDWAKGIVDSLKNNKNPEEQTAKRRPDIPGTSSILNTPPCPAQTHEVFRLPSLASPILSTSSSAPWSDHRPQNRPCSPTRVELGQCYEKLTHPLHTFRIEGLCWKCHHEREQRLARFEVLAIKGDVDRVFVRKKQEERARMNRNQMLMRMEENEARELARLAKANMTMNLDAYFEKFGKRLGEVTETVMESLKEKRLV